MTRDGDLAARARAWRTAQHAAVCDLVEPWAHGTVVRASAYPSYWEFNLVRVEDNPAMTAEELARSRTKRSPGSPTGGSTSTW